MTCVPIAPCAERNPSAVASLSVRSTSLAASDRGRRPALRAGMTLDDLSGGKETSAPGGGVLAGPEDAGEVPATKAPLMASCPHAALTWGCAASVARVPASNAATLASTAG